MDRQTRKSIKSDKFAEEVSQTWEFFTEHSQETKRYGLIALAVLIIGLGIYFYHGHQVSARQEMLAKAMLADPALAPSQTPPALTDEQIQQRQKLYQPIAAEQHGTIEGSVAQMMLAAIQADKGTPEGTAAAQKMYQDVMDSAPTDYASVARIALAQSYAGEGKLEQAKTLLQYAIDHPTALVSKESATLNMAQILEKSNPAEAKKLLQPLVQSPHGAVSRAAVTEMGQFAQ